MALTKEQIMKIAKLAMIELTDEEMDKLGSEVSGILDWVEMLHEVDTDGVAPTYQVTGIDSVMRSDEEERFGEPDKLLENSPLEKRAYQVLVKKILNK